ncbi:CDP-2,3-bis-(O-geranylgeranyl)-sn-glycerol synthase [Candidatus Bathyarchaeota archaeon]|nr:CDP-2,3-bis-(O-geranylgeranyl)-sn-glycerol synthase [Candidatus Bathyarchaeota archaeon]
MGGSAQNTFTITDLLIAIYIAVPAYVANSTPVVLGGGAPIDRGRRLIDGRRMLGTNKTIKGFAYGLLLGSLAGLAEAVLFANYALISVGVIASLGALLGDLFGAFLKRRLDIAPGNALPVVDQLDFILGAILFTYPLLNVTVGAVLILVIATLPIHLLSNAVAYMLRLKNRRW